MNMVSFTQYSVQWNGSLLLKVIPSKGVHQGDPLSPYLFILCLERLSILLEEAIRDNMIHPIVFRGQIQISHLFFADDIFLFTKAKLTGYQNLRNILQKFCQCLGQIISTHKSHIWFSPNIPRRTKDLIVGTFEIPTTTQIGTYLRTPILTTRRTTNAYQYIVDKIQNKIEGWQDKYLSVVDRVTLIKSLTASIPLYAMQTMLLSQKVSRNLDKMSCQFL